MQPKATRLTIDELTARVQAASPGDRITQAGWGEAGPDNAWNFRSTSAEGHRIHTFIDQYTGAITGRDDYQDKWMQWFFDLHAYLLAGDTGEFLNGFVGLATVILSVTGLVVWWPGVAHWPFGFRYLWGAGWKRQNYDMHKVVGFLFQPRACLRRVHGRLLRLPVLVQEGDRTRHRHDGDGGRAESRHRVDRSAGDAGAVPQRGGRGAAGSGGRSRCRFRRKPGEPVTVRTKEARDWHRIGLNYVYLEPADARIVRSDRFSDVTVGTQAILLMYPLHFGRFGGRWDCRRCDYGVMVLYVVIGVTPFVADGDGPAHVLEPVVFKEVETGATEKLRAKRCSCPRFGPEHAVSAFELVKKPH